MHPSSKGLYVPVSTQLKFISRKYRQYQEDKDACRKIFDGRRQLAKAMHGYALGYFRHLRAFNFQRQSDSLADLLHGFASMLLADEYESLSKLDALARAYELAKRHMRFKLDHDEKLQESDYVPGEVEKLEQLYEEFEAKVNERIVEYRA